ncbi:hypothetical protein L3Q82_005852 [Scortum barcoo]|uniref:Uncharacterized protein n=1 Tax=Scortum barcoo TaxID=214431 RepID=A0ACB8V770_9TELE|nr:hypothetical protein L3Q82_005852 [Scortum barcoo]
MFSASIVVNAAVRSCGHKQGLWCLSWWQSPNPVVDTVDRYLARPSKPQPGRSWRQKLQVWEEFGEAMEEDYRSTSKRFWQTVQAPQKRGSSTLPTLFTVSATGGELLTSTEDIVGRWKKYFEDLLNPTDLPSNEEAEDGDSEGGGLVHPSPASRSH